MTKRSFSDKFRIKFCMIQIDFGKIKLRFDFTFFAVIALFMLTDGGLFGLSALAACALHEISHLIVMIIFSISVDTITFYGAGIKISSKEIYKSSGFKRNAVFLAGSVGNFIFAVIFWLFGERPAAFINLFTGIFNLLPIGEYDGAFLLKNFVIRRCKAENVDFIMNAAGAVSAAISFALILFVGGKPSFTLITTVVYIVSAFCSGKI